MPRLSQDAGHALDVEHVLEEGVDAGDGQVAAGYGPDDGRLYEREDGGDEAPYDNRRIIAPFSIL